MPTAADTDVALISRVRAADAEARAAQGCVYPHCTRRATSCDHDHVVPYDHDDPAGGGPSCDCTIAPLCRHHHQLKTRAGWRYSVLDTGLWLWSDRHGQQFLRDRIGTTDVTPAGRCRRRT